MLSIIVILGVVAAMACMVDYCFNSDNHLEIDSASIEEQERKAEADFMRVNGRRFYRSGTIWTTPDK